MKPRYTVFGGMMVCISLASRNDANCRFSCCQPGVICAVGTAMVMHLVNVNSAYVFCDGSFNILVHLGVISAQVAADLFAEGSKRYNDRQAEIVFVARGYGPVFG